MNTQTTMTVTPFLIQTRRWWLFIVCAVSLYLLNYLPTLLWGGDPASPFTLMLGSYAFNGVFCAVLAIPLIFVAMPKMQLHISKWFFYGFYPGHLAVIAAVQFML